MAFNFIRNLLKTKKEEEYDPLAMCLPKVFAQGGTSRVLSSQGSSDFSNLSFSEPKRNFGKYLATTSLIGVVSLGAIDFYTTRYVPNFLSKVTKVEVHASQTTDKSKKKEKGNPSNATDIALVQERSYFEQLADENIKKFAKESHLEKSLNPVEEVKPADYNQLVAFYRENKDFVEKTKPLYQVVYEGKLDFLGTGDLQNFIFYKNGTTEVKLSNGSIKRLSSNETYEFFIASILNSEEIKNNFTTDEGQLLYRDLVTENQVLSLEKKHPGYINNLLKLGEKTRVYVEETREVFDPAIKRLESRLK